MQRSRRCLASDPWQDESTEPPQDDAGPDAHSSDIVTRTKRVDRYGHDDATDAQTLAAMSDLHINTDAPPFDSRQKIESGTEQEEQPFEHRHLQVPIPTSSSGLTTFAYQRALLNPIPASKLSKEATYDLTKYTPTFIHDTLMLPGSLANLLSKGSSEDILNRMTPGLLFGHHAHIDSETLQPCLVRSADSQTHVQGMVIFGQGKTSRDAVHQHYRPGAKRRKVGIQVDIWVRIPPHERGTTTEVMRLERRTVQAHAWIWSGEIEGCTRGKCRDWTIEAYLAGNLEEELPMRVEMNGRDDEEQHDCLGKESCASSSEPGVAEETEERGNTEHGEPTYYLFERATWFE